MSTISLSSSIFLDPCTQFSNSVVSSRKRSPEVTIKLASAPTLRCPKSVLPNNLAGEVVRASNALVSSRPYRTDFLRFFKKSFLFFNPCAVRVKGIPALAIEDGFIGAWFQALMSSNDT